ncbi:hypothetical protein D9758_003890 [Tetrapyrgos nigripes]|uniref:Uncharacterized protein n=1 Tax=Tetrapyrgos nigripes TaxID=182062 RepID=A0A8H5GLZ3_9AGAR|nr:hypothetical protein D9758_003890 [Tetrapyrgos nigripes]
MSSSSPSYKIKRKPPPKIDFNERYPPPDPADPFLPLSVLRDRSAGAAQNKDQESNQPSSPTYPPKSQYRPRSQAVFNVVTQTDADSLAFSVSKSPNSSQLVLLSEDYGRDDARSILSTATGTVGWNDRRQSSAINPYAIVSGGRLGSGFDTESFSRMGFDFDRCHAISPDPLPCTETHALPTPIPPNTTAAEPGSPRSPGTRLARLFGLKDASKKTSQTGLNEVSSGLKEAQTLTPVGKVDNDALLSGVFQPRNETSSKPRPTIKRLRRISNTSIASSAYSSLPSSPTRMERDAATIASVGSIGSIAQPSLKRSLSPLAFRSEDISELKDGVRKGVDEKNGMEEQKERVKQKAKRKQKRVSLPARSFLTGREVHSESESAPRGWRHFSDVEESDFGEEGDSDYVSTSDIFRPRRYSISKRRMYSKTKETTPSLDISSSLAPSDLRFPRSPSNLHHHHASTASSSSGSSNLTSSSSSRPTSMSTSTSASSYPSTPNSTPRSSTSTSISHSHAKALASASSSSYPEPEPEPAGVVHSNILSSRAAHSHAPRHLSLSLSHSPAHVEAATETWTDKPSKSPVSPISPISPKSPRRVFSDSVIPVFAAYLSSPTSSSEDQDNDRDTVPSSPVLDSEPSTTAARAGTWTGTSTKHLDADENWAAEWDRDREKVGCSPAGPNSSLTGTRGHISTTFSNHSSWVGVSQPVPEGLGKGVTYGKDVDQGLGSGLGGKRPSESKFKLSVKKILKALKPKEKEHEEEDMLKGPGHGQWQGQRQVHETYASPEVQTQTVAEVALSSSTNLEETTKERDCEVDEQQQ